MLFRSPLREVYSPETMRRTKQSGEESTESQLASVVAYEFQMAYQGPNYGHDFLQSGKNNYKTYTNSDVVIKAHLENIAQKDLLVGEIEMELHKTLKQTILQGQMSEAEENHLKKGSKHYRSVSFDTSVLGLQKPVQTNAPEARLERENKIKKKNEASMFIRPQDVKLEKASKIGRAHV